MKLSSRILTLVIVSSLILVFSCGKKDTGRPGGYYYGNPTSGLSADVANLVGRYLNQTQCREGRITQSINFSATQSTGQGYNQTLIQGNLQTGHLRGRATTVYIGVNQAGHILIVSKVTDGARAVGFNFALSLCRISFSDNYGVQPLFHEQRMPSIAEMSPLVVTDPTGCPVGTVNSGNGGIILNIPGYRYLEPSRFFLAFAPIQCIH